MAAIDDPDQYTFNRAGKISGRSDAPVAMTAWNEVLLGPLKTQYMERLGLGAGLRAVAAWRERQAGGLKPGMTRRGKPVDVGQ